MIAYLKQVISGADDATCHRFCMVVGCLTLAIATLVLCVAEAFGAGVSVAIATVSAPLAGMAGYAYGKAKDVGS